VGPKESGQMAPDKIVMLSKLASLSPLHYLCCLHCIFKTLSLPTQSTYLQSHLYDIQEHLIRCLALLLPLWPPLFPAVLWINLRCAETDLNIIKQELYNVPILLSSFTVLVPLCSV